METRFSYAAVGAFVIGAGALWIMFSMWLLFGNFNADYKRYDVYIGESVSGLVEGASVTYLGVPVGQVHDIGLKPGDPSMVRLALEVRSGTPVKIDTKATLMSQGLTGLYFVELRGGSPEAPLLEPGADGEVPVIPATPSFYARLEETATFLANDVGRIVDRLGKLLDDENIDSIGATLKNLSEVTGAVAGRRDSIDAAISDAAESMARLRRLVAGVADRSGDIDQAITQISGAAGEISKASDRMPAVAEDVEAITGQLREASRSLNELVKRSSTGVESLSSNTVPNLNRLLNDMRATLESLERLGRRLEAQPNALFVGEPERKPGPGEEQ